MVRINGGSQGNPPTIGPTAYAARQARGAVEPFLFRALPMASFSGFTHQRDVSKRLKVLLDEKKSNSLLTTRLVTETKLTSSKLTRQLYRPLCSKKIRKRSEWDVC